MARGGSTALGLPDATSPEKEVDGVERQPVVLRKVRRECLEKGVGRDEILGRQEPVETSQFLALTHGSTRLGRDEGGEDHGKH